MQEHVSDRPRYAELYLQGRLRLDEMVTARVPLDGLNGALDALPGRVVTIWVTS